MNTTDRATVRAAYKRTDFGGWEFELLSGDKVLASAWVAGSKRDAREEALSEARRLGVEVRS